MPPLQARVDYGLLDWKASEPEDFPEKPTVFRVGWVAVRCSVRVRRFLATFPYQNPFLRNQIVEIDCSSLPTCLQSEAVEERKPIRNQGKAANHEQHAERDQQRARGHFQRVHARAEAAVKLQKTLHQK